MVKNVSFDSNMENIRSFYLQNMVFLKNKLYGNPFQFVGLLNSLNIKYFLHGLSVFIAFFCFLAHLCVLYL